MAISELDASSNSWIILPLMWPTDIALPTVRRIWAWINLISV